MLDVFSTFTETFVYNYHIFKHGITGKVLYHIQMLNRGRQSTCVLFFMQTIVGDKVKD